MQCDCLSYRSNDLNHVICADAEQRPTKLLGLQDDEQFVPAFEMEDAADSDHAEESD